MLNNDVFPILWPMDTPHIGLYGQTAPERGALFAFELQERVDKFVALAL